MGKKSWIYYANKDDLVAYAIEFGLDETGSIDDLRKRMSQFITEGDFSSEVELRLTELEIKHVQIRRSRNTSPVTDLTVETTDSEEEQKERLEVPKQKSRTTTPTRSAMDETQWQIEALRQQLHELNIATTRTEIENVTKQLHREVPNKNVNKIDQVRKWQLKYTGNTDALAFIERVEELAEVYDITCDILPKMMSELLTEKALTWFRNNREPNQKWDAFKKDFLKYFLPPRYHERLEDKIRQTYQKPNEAVKDYALTMQEMMRHTNLDKSQQLERIYYNMLAEYQLYIKRKDFTSLTELLTLAEDYEIIRKRNTSQVYMVNEEDHPRNPSTARLRCRNCGQQGHWANECRNRRKLFCWDCGQQGLRTIDCCRKAHTGNDQGPLRTERGTEVVTTMNPRDMNHQ